jgi:histidinol-phosphate aminotransferase
VEGAVIREVPCIEATGQYDFKAMRQAVDTTTRLVWICNPNNPTGTYETVEDIRKFIGTLPKDVLVIIDEAYIDFVTSVEVPTARALLDEFPNVFIMRTFSKAYGLANYRVGYMMSSAELANYIQTIRLPYNLNTLSQVAAEAAFGDREFLRSTVEKNAAERALWEQMLDEVGGTYYKSGANFIFMSVPNAEVLADAWLAKGYQVRRGQRDNWLRVTLPTASDGAIMRSILKDYMARQ